MAEGRIPLPESQETFRSVPFWTKTYKKWDTWEDPDEVAKQHEDEQLRLKNMRENNMPCSHDHSAERRIMEMPIADKVQACRNFRHKGNLFHNEGQYRRAGLQYRQALVYYDFCFPDEDDVQQELDEIRQTCLLNSAACFLACRDLDQVLDCCYQALREDPDNVKALYRRAVVHRLRDNFEEASTDLGRALAQRPNDVNLRKEAAVLQSKIASYKEQSKVMGKQIFGRDRSVMDTSSPPGDCSKRGRDDAAEHAWCPSIDAAATARGNREGGYTVARAAPSVASVVDDLGADHEGEEARRRHDLSLALRTWKRF